ncbi:hypothetical protein M069_3992 [Bacteroides fragilis str. B1 (UDC16-1)]|nr:hypothetical protein M069_3992 [Bacteroides fragilis str. B1 (UDC16-1)]
MSSWRSSVAIVTRLSHDGGRIHLFYLPDGLRYGDFGPCVVFAVIRHSIYTDHIARMESTVYIKAPFIAAMRIGTESFTERTVDAYFYGGSFYLSDLVSAGEVQKQGIVGAVGVDNGIHH